MGNIQEQPALFQLEQLRALNHHLRSAIDRVDDGVLILESDPVNPPGPRILFVNRGARRITGFLRAEDLLGQPIGLIYDALTLRDFLVRLPRVAENCGKTYEMDTLTNCSGNQKKLLRWTVTAIRDSDYGPMNFLITISPVGSHLARYQISPVSHSSSGGPWGGSTEMSGSQIQASKMESLALVASGIAHDFNNILTTVVANLSLAQLETAVESDLRRHIDDATSACTNAKSLIQQLLAFARGDCPVKKQTHLGTLLRESVRLATYGANVRCEVSLSPDLWSAKVDRTQITQVLSNLLINARQAMPNGGVIQAGAENRVVAGEDDLNLAPGKYVVLTIRDRGCGIRETDLKQIFDPFFTTKKDGSGLGLATCYSLVENHHGTILVRSKVNVGTEFKVFLPATGVAGEDEVEPSEGHLISGEGSVLVVDDQESVRAVAAAILSKLGYEAVTVSSGQEAVEVYAQRFRSGSPISAVLMDMTLPGGLSGEDTFEQIRRLDPNVTTIATSGYFDEDSQERFCGRGFSGLLPKPYTAESLSRELHAVLRTGEIPEDAGVAGK